ncbi:tyrosine-protein phosphatase non-receptor type substrate 1-like isoform X4 [Petaurus breviceps papuanus]|uniref:tyrosine-protein phosphatase non-receptor type substrate 1-like isoform X4 n=1 Tax=Petaurus breviceps papuanus TaxID=3040969 RepID=UPI0036D858DD
MFSLSFWISVLPIVLICWAWVDTQDTSLVQPSGFVTATIGGSVILECRSKTNLPPGPVRWYKGTRPNRQLIFSDTGSYPRVQKVNNTNLVLDICINNITIQDEGVYYCIKFQKNPEKELSSGGGTLLIVGSSPCLSRPGASKKNQSKKEPTKNNEIVYADLQHMGKNPQSMSPVERKGLHSEYATIHVQ